jgi:hypothetical protein
MSTQILSPESFDATAKSMLDALVKASAEVEKSVADFSAQLLSFGDEVQQLFNQELKAADARMHDCLSHNLASLSDNKQVMINRLLDRERAELTRISETGHQLRQALSTSRGWVEEKVEAMIAQQVAEYQKFLEHAHADIGNCLDACREEHKGKHESGIEQLDELAKQFQQQLASKLSGCNEIVQRGAGEDLQKLTSLGEQRRKEIASLAIFVRQGLDNSFQTAVAEIEKCDSEGNAAFDQMQQRESLNLAEAGQRWKANLDLQVESCGSLLSHQGVALQDAFSEQLAVTADATSEEINHLCRQAHEKIESTCKSLSTELQIMQADYVRELESIINGMEHVVLQHSNDPENNTARRQHKARLLQEQMDAHLARWGTSLVDSVKNAASQLECRFNQVADGFHLRVESSRSSAITLLVRESKLMEKELDNVVSEFQRQLDNEEVQISKIRSAGQDAAMTVTAYRKAMLSFQDQQESL